MAASAEDVTRSVFAALAEYNASETTQVPPAAGTVLLGPEGAVDSLGLVRLVMLVERRAQDDFGVPVSLTDEKAMSQRNSPFRSVGALVEYLVQQLNEPR
ncbi:MAG: acyl carrier protein [Candidatus Eisenbacteria bacterium]